MKKITRTVAMILVLVMVASSFSGCLTYHLFKGGGPGNDPISATIVLGAIAIDIVTLPIQIVYFIVIQVQKAQRNSRGKKFDGIDTFSHTVKALPQTELISLTRTLNSLPEAEIDSLTQRHDSLPKTEIDSYAKTANSFSEAEITAMVTAFNNLSEAEIISSIETLNSMPEETLVSMMNNLRHIEFQKQN